MPALWSPVELATRFAPYIEELHDVFAMHGLHYGSPEDIRVLAGRLDGSNLLCEELAALVRSIVLREGGAIPRTDLLEIFAIAIAGARMDPRGEELQLSVRQLLSFLHHALRRPWNEPPGEERLHPEDDGRRADAAHELRDGATRVEAEGQSLRPARPTGEAPGEEYAEASALPANVIPFGRARAVFSRLARMEPGYQDGYAASARDEHDSPSVAESAPMEIAAAPRTEAERGLLPLSPPNAPVLVVERSLDVASADAFLVHSDTFLMQDAFLMQSEVIPANRPSEPAVTASAEMEPLVAAGAEIVEMELPEEMVPPEEPQREEGESETTESEAAPVPTNQDGIETVVPVESESAVVPTDTAASKPIAELPAAPQPAAAAIEASSANAKFEAEPFLAPRPRPRRIALAEGVAAAAVVIATFLVFALDSRRAADMTAGAAVPGTSLPRATTPGSGITDVEMIETRGTAPGASPTGAVASTSKPSADVQATAQIVRRSNAYDDYIAPPYSSMPMQPSVAPRSVAAPSGQVAVSLESNPGSGMNSVRPEHSASPSLSAAVAGPVMAKTVAISRAYRDPDAMLVGDAPNGSLSPAVVSNRPIHPNVSAGVMAGYLVSAPKPDYPLMAKIAHIDGPVVLRVEITRDGEVAETHVVSGHHMLRHAAEEAVRHWRYRPYEVDGRPVGVSTTIAVRFRSGR